MGETQIYSQRLHKITEKRRILSEVDIIQRELEQQRVKLHQLKRKSLRDRWLMDGVDPTAADTENPLTKTEGQIRDLELLLESLQSELLYLENPELKASKDAKSQEVTLQKELVNGEKSLQQIDQNENLKERVITEEEAGQTEDGQEERPPIPQRDLSSSTEEAERHPVPASQGEHVSENHEHNPHLELSSAKEPNGQETLPSQNVEGSVQREADDDHKPLSEESKIQSSESSQELLDQKGEHHDPPLELILEVDKVEKIIPNEKLGSMENTLDQNFTSPSSELSSISQRTDDSLHLSGMEDFNSDLFKQNQDGKESLLEEITKLVNLEEQNEAGQVFREQLTPESMITPSNEENGQNLEKEVVLHSNTPQQESEKAPHVVLSTQEEAKEPVGVTMEVEAPDGLHQVSEGQTQNSTPLPIESPQSSVKPFSDQEVCTPLPCTDHITTPPSPSKVDQVQISQVIVVPAPSQEKHSPSSSHQPVVKESSTAPESQPLIQKPQETDAHHRANTAEARDKSTPTKKKTCQCCVVM